MNVSFVNVAKIQSGRGSDKNLTTKGYKGKASSGRKQWISSKSVTVHCNWHSYDFLSKV